eukprot:6204764-Pleurochrysis_carterae.AAC.4
MVDEFSVEAHGSLLDLILVLAYSAVTSLNYDELSYYLHAIIHERQRISNEPTLNKVASSIAAYQQQQFDTLLRRSNSSTVTVVSSLAPTSSETAAHALDAAWHRTGLAGPDPLRATQRPTSYRPAHSQSQHTLLHLRRRDGFALQPQLGPTISFLPLR